MQRRERKLYADLAAEEGVDTLAGLIQERRRKQMKILLVFYEGFHGHSEDWEGKL